jgi:di/tricarboxylate transporter
MSLAVISVCALAVAIIVSCFTTINVGVLAIAMAWIIGVYIGDMRVNDVIAGFPTPLFMTLAGVTLLFSLAQCNGTLDRLAHHAVRSCRGNRGAVPIMFFGLAAALASMGPGNIATAALIAPMAMTTASRFAIPPFLMAIMVGNGANAGSLSPFAPTGIIVSGLMTRIGMPGHELQTYLALLLAHAAVAFAGYFLFGGLKLFAGTPATSPSAGTRATGDAGGGSDDRFEPRHWFTLAVIGTLILSVLWAPIARNLGLEQWAFDVNVGLGAFLGAVILVLTRSADDGEAIKRMPWRVIMMVCGVTVLIAILERAQGIDLLVSLISRISTPGTVTGVVAFITGVISVYSSTSGVVLPAFLPMVPGLAQQLGADALGIANAMNVGGHLVDVSSLSTIGALCVAGAPADDSRTLFYQLLFWGLSMCVVGALLCYLFF